MIPFVTSSSSAPRTATCAESAISLVDVSLRRGRTQVFEGLNLSLAEARIGLIGDNGAGKSSLLRLLCGLDIPQQGSVHIAGHNLQTQGSERARLVGLMFQNPEDQIIFPVVEEEIALSMRSRGLTKRDALPAARALLAQRGLADWAERAVSSLSQGQRQQVCWLALLAGEPRLLLLDEPFASLDLPGQARLATDISEASQQLIVSTHLLSHVRDFPRVIWLEQGRVRADGAGRDVCAAYEDDVAARVARTQSTPA